MNKIKLNTAYGIIATKKTGAKKRMGDQFPNRKPIEEMNDDELIFWMLFERDAMTALRNFLGDCTEKNKEALELDINETESRYEKYLAAIKDRMRKGGKPNAR